MSTYADGYCRGFMDAMRVIQRNRAHYRQLLGLPEMSQADVLWKVYARPPGDVSDSTIGIVERTTGVLAEGIDLYLVPAIVGCSVGDDGQITYEMLPAVGLG